MQRVLGNEVTDFNPDKNVYIDFFDRTPFCWINVKKSAGGVTADTREIRKHIDNYGDLLLQQIDILRPTDIVCLCGNSNGALIEKLKSLPFQAHIYTADHPAYQYSRDDEKYKTLKQIV